MFVSWERLRDIMHVSWWRWLEEQARASPPDDPDKIVVHFGGKGIINVSWITQAGQAQFGFVRIYTGSVYLPTK